MENKHKKCKECGSEYVPYSSLQKFCSLECFKSGKKPDLKLKVPKAIKQISDKRKIENAKYSVLRIEFLGKPENKICPITGKPTTDIHHMKGRVGNLFLDTKYWVALSREGHKFVEENPEWSKENGYSLDRLSK